MHYEYLSRILGGDGAGDSRRAGDAARVLVPGWAAGVLRPLADGGSPVRAVAHPLGFTCLPVERSGRDGVCVHLWSPRLGSAAPTTSAIHAHCWHLTSCVLLGRLENQLAHVTDALPDTHADEPYRLLEVRSRGDTDELVPTTRLVRCAPGRRQVISAGDVYSVPAGEFHSTAVPLGTEAATVVLGRVDPSVADCSLGPPGAVGHQVRRRRCDAEQTAAAARIVLDQLQSARAA
jgi:hypothetical protein